MAPRLAAQALVALGALGLALALLTLRLLAPPARTVDVGGPGDAYGTASFYAPEVSGGASFRWSGPNSAIVLPAHATGGALLRVRAHGASRAQRLALAAPGAGAPAALSMGEGWRVYQLLVAAPGPPHRVALEADLVTPGPADPRELGVAVDWVRWSPLPRGPGALPGALGAAGLLVWAAVLAGAAAGLVLPGREDGPGAARPTHALRECIGPTVVAGMVAGALVVWAWRDLDGLMWLLPLAQGWLAAATAALAGAWALVAGPERWAVWPTDALRRSFGPTGRTVGAVAVLALAHAALWAPLPGAWRGAAALVILWAPGWLAARALLAHEDDRAMALVLGVAGALALQVCIALAAAALPWGASGPALLALSNLASAAALALGARGEGRESGGGGQHRRPPARRRDLALALVIMLVAAALRLPALGSAELHDDEASVLIAAAELARGDSAVLLRQLKGPDQIVLPAGPLALTGQISEQTARLPFAVAGLAVVLGAMAVARGPLGAGGAAAVAGLVLALDGLLIAFARIVQYQSVVMLMGLAAFWCCWRFARGGPGGPRYLLAAALATAVALLGHYDAVYVTPALALLVALGARRRGWGAGEAARYLAGPALLGAGLLLSFYVPFVLHPHFAETIGHVRERTGQGGGGWAGYNNLAVSYELLKVYNAPAQLWAIAALLGAALLGGLARVWADARAETDDPGRAAAAWATLVWLVAAGGAMSFLTPSRAPTSMSRSSRRRCWPPRGPGPSGRSGGWRVARWRRGGCCWPSGPGCTSRWSSCGRAPSTCGATRRPWSRRCRGAGPPWPSTPRRASGSRRATGGRPWASCTAGASCGARRRATSRARCWPGTCAGSAAAAPTRPST